MQTKLLAAWVVIVLVKAYIYYIRCHFESHLPTVQTCNCYLTESLIPNWKLCCKHKESSLLTKLPPGTQASKWSQWIISCFLQARHSKGPFLEAGTLKLMKSSIQILFLSLVVERLWRMSKHSLLSICDVSGTLFGHFYLPYPLNLTMTNVCGSKWAQRK